MNVKRLALLAVGIGIPLGAVIGGVTGYWHNRTDTLKALYSMVDAPNSNQKVATDTFIRGAYARAQGLPENLAACEGVPNSATIFCYEGYWYAKVLDGLKRGDKKLTEFPKDDSGFKWTGSAGVARDVYVTAYGLAIFDSGEAFDKHKATFTDAKDYGHAFDGYVFMQARTIGLDAASQICANEPAEYKPSCEFGVGRAAWFEKEGEKWIKGKPEGFLNGFNFAKNFTSQKSASELETVKVEHYGEKIGLIDKLLWMKSPAKDAESVKLYACQAQQHPAQCMSAAGTNVQ